MKRTVPDAFVDSNVVVTSLISHKGASYYLFWTTNQNFAISTLSVKEIRAVVKRLDLDMTALENMITKRLSVTKLTALSELREKYLPYVSDPHDAHVVAGTVASKASFLLTYNVKHFNTNIIKRDFDVITLTPAQYMQYLRSMGKLPNKK